MIKITESLTVNAKGEPFVNFVLYLNFSKGSTEIKMVESANTRDEVLKKVRDILSDTCQEIKKFLK